MRTVRETVTVAAFAAGVALALIASCSSSDPPHTTTSTGPEPTLTSIQDHVFTPRCSEAGCHGIDLPKQGVALFNEQVTLQTMVNKPPTVGDASLTYPALIVPGDPDRSFLVAKLTGPLPDHNGLVMPPLRSPLTPETLAAIRAWIAGMPR